MKYFLYTLLIGCLFVACQNENGEYAVATSDPHGNPPAQGFNMEESDAEAIVIADKVMQAMGGYQNWNKARYFYWNFFGARTLLWDKLTGDVRVESARDEFIGIINVHEEKGKIKQREDIYEPGDSLFPIFYDRVKGAWINDSYWLVMPFKLKDSGVTLKYVGEDSTSTGALADVLQLTFNEVGKTPENKYLVYIDKETNLVTQWDFFRTADDEEPTMSTPWENYQEMGGILLSDGRGERGLTDVKVLESVPEGAFESFDPLVWE